MSSASAPIDFVTRPSSRLNCPICTEVLCDAVVTPCQHSYCAVCLHHALALKPECPLCRAPVNPADPTHVRANLLVRDLLDEMDVRCPNAPAGCHAVFALAELPSHAAACPYRPARCPFRIHGCPFAGPWHAVDAHVRRGAAQAHPNLPPPASAARSLTPASAPPSTPPSTPPSAPPSSPPSAPPSSPPSAPPCPYAAVEPFIDRTMAQIEVLEDTLVQKRAEVDALHAALAAVARQRGSNVRAAVSDAAAELLAAALAPDVAAALGLEAEVVVDGDVAGADGGGEGESGGDAGPVGARGSELRSRADGDGEGGGAADAWSPVRLECARVLKGHTSGVTALCVGSGYLYSGSQDATIRVWSLESFDCLAVLQGHSFTVWALQEAFVAVPDDVYSDYDDDGGDAHVPGEPGGVSRRLFSASSDHTIVVWAGTLSESREPQFERFASLDAHAGKIYALHYLAAHNVLLSGDSTGVINITHAWSLHTLFSIPVRPNSPISAFALSGNTLFVAAQDCTVSTLSLEPLDSGAELDPPTVVVEAEAKVLALALTPHHLFASASYKIGVYDAAADFAADGVLTGHRWPVWQMEVVPSGDASYLISASFDHRLKVWDVTPGRTPSARHSTADPPRFACVRTIDAHHGYIHALAQGHIAGTGRVLVSGSGDRTIRVWAQAQHRD